MRLSDEEREDALEVLNEHVRTGRLDLDEYGTRSAKVTAAKRVSELAPLFDDLPSPRPSALIAGATAAVPVRRENTLTQWMIASAVPIAAVVAVAIFILSRGRLFLVFALPIAVALITAQRRR